MKDYERLLKQVLEKELVFLDKAFNHLEFSLEKVKKINLSDHLEDDALELLDSFATRFLRLYEVLVHQALRTVLQLLGEFEKTTIDNLNKAEKLELITSADDFNYIRLLRNKVAHEYAEDEWKEIYSEIIIYSSHLIISTEKLKDFVRERGWFID